MGRSGDVRTIGVIPAEEIATLSGGRLAQDVPVSLNRKIFDYDQIVICGPGVPARSRRASPAATSTSFPGIAGAEVINFTHWLGALITNYEVIGNGYTPVRAVIDRAASMVTVPTACFASSSPTTASPACISATRGPRGSRLPRCRRKRHIVWLDKPVHKVLSVMPPMYDDVWTAGKGMYKLEPVVADGGEVVIYAPHIHEVSVTHGRLIEEIGYHCRDYFTAQPERFATYPGGVLAHSTHVKGLGTYDRRPDRDAARDGDARHRHIGGALPQDQPRVSRSRLDRHRRMAGPRIRWRRWWCRARGSCFTGYVRRRQRKRVEAEAVTGIEPTLHS